MKKHNRDARRLVALVRLYKYFGPMWLSLIHARGVAPDNLLGFGKQVNELLALESRLPPEMVAWAKLNR